VTITMLSALQVGRAELAAPNRPRRGTPDLELGDLAALLAYCKVEIGLHALQSVYDARVFLEGGPGEDGAWSHTVGAIQSVEAARVLSERLEAAG
jgi:hypothetical protein